MFSGRSMGDVVDPRLLKTWLRISESGSNQDSLPLTRTRFIDSATSGVIEETADENFAVLSHV